jgi:hypothetical protein
MVLGQRDFVKMIQVQRGKSRHIGMPILAGIIYRVCIRGM